MKVVGHSSGWRLLHTAPEDTSLYIDIIHKNPDLGVEGYNLYCVYDNEIRKVIVTEMDFHVEGLEYTYIAGDDMGSISSAIKTLGMAICGCELQFREAWMREE